MVLIVLWCAAHKKGRTILRVGITDGVSGGLVSSKAVAAAITARKVSAADGFWRGSRAAVRNGGRGVALVKKAGDMFASRDDSTSSTVWIFFKVS